MKIYKAVSSDQLDVTPAGCLTCGWRDGIPRPCSCEPANADGDGNLDLLLIAEAERDEARDCLCSLLRAYPELHRSHATSAQAHALRAARDLLDGVA